VPSSQPRPSRPAGAVPSAAFMFDSAFVHVLSAEFSLEPYAPWL
jgi:hypothetical protein